MLVERGLLKRTRLGVTLPLNAIYSKSGVPANIILSRLLDETNPLVAVIALLTTAEPYNGSGYGEFEVISSYGAGLYEIKLDGKPVGTLTPKKEEPPELDHEIKPGERLITWTPIVLPRRPIITYELNLITGIKEVSPGNTQLGDVNGRLQYAREVVIPKYTVDLSR